jgi:hypothetical protein
MRYHRQGGGLFSTVWNIGKKILGFGKKAAPMISKTAQFVDNNRDTIRDVAREVVPRRYRDQVDRYGDYYEDRRDDYNRYADRFRGRGRGFAVTSRDDDTRDTRGGKIDETTYLHSMKLKEKMAPKSRVPRVGKKINLQNELMKLIK